MGDPLQQLISIILFGVLAGGVFSLFALGLSLVFGVAKIVDLTYAGYIAIASYFLFTLEPIVGVLASVLLSVALTIPIAILVERFIIRPLRTSEIQVMMATFGVALLIQYSITGIWGSLASAVPAYFSGALTVGQSVVSMQQFVQLPIGLLISIGVILFLGYTKHGKAIISVSQDSIASWLVGINVNSIMALTIVLSAVLAASAAVLSAPISAIPPSMGWSPFITAFIVVVFGGIGNVKGTVIASYMYGLILNSVNVLISPSWSDIVGITLLVTILILKPSGVLGTRAPA